MIISENAAPDAAEQYYKDSSTTPATFTQSVFNSFHEGRWNTFQAINIAQAALTDGKYDKKIQDTYDAIQANSQQESELATTPQKAARLLPGLVANGLGMASTGIGALLGEAGSLVGEGISFVGSKILPGSLGVFARKSLPWAVENGGSKYLPQSLAQLGKATTKGFTTMAGFSLPDAYVHNFHKDTNSLSWGGFTEEVGANGAIGALLSIPGYAAGVLLKNIFEPGEKPPMPGTEAAKSMEARLQEAYNAKKIDKPTYEWGKMFYSDPHNPLVQHQAVDMLTKRGHAVDAAKGKVHFSMLSEENWRNLTGAYSDELNFADSATDKTPFSDYILGSEFEKLKNSPDQLAGLQGWLAEADHKLAAKGEKLRALDEGYDIHQFNGIKENMAFSQKDLFDFMRKSQLDRSHLENMPVTIPENIKKHIAAKEKINKLKGKLAKERRKGLPENKKTIDRVAELEKKMPKLLTPKEELQQLRNHFLSDKGLPRNWRMSEQYQRLSELADVWHNARDLLDRVHVEADYNKLAAYQRLINGYLKVMDSQSQTFVDLNRVNNSLKGRIADSLGSTGEYKATAFTTEKTPEQIIEESTHVPSDEEAAFSDFDEQIDQVDDSTIKNSYYESKKRYQQFKAAGEKIKEMVDCVGRNS